MTAILLLWFDAKGHWGPVDVGAVQVTPLRAMSLRVSFVFGEAKAVCKVTVFIPNTWAAYPALVWDDFVTRNPWITVESILTDTRVLLTSCMFTAHPVTCGLWQLAHDIGGKRHASRQHNVRSNPNRFHETPSTYA